METFSSLRSHNLVARAAAAIRITIYVNLHYCSIDCFQLIFPLL